MPGKISRLFINELIARTNIIDLIKSRIQLTQHGKYFRANCPFHNEKTPSFTVNNEKKFYYCFGCGAHGNAIDFLINYDRLNFIESVEELAIINNFKIVYSRNDQYYNDYDKTELYKNYKTRFTLYKIMENLNHFYKKNLTHKYFFLARDYLNNRGFNNDTINLYSIGYAPMGWNNLLKNYSHYHDHNQFLIESGILAKHPRGYLYDFFRNRIIFPIRDKHGRTLGFGGRSINHDIPKYLNSPETLIFHKKRQLYGLFELYQYNCRPSCILIVEGYTDVLTLAQNGINYAVSSLGINTSSEHIQILFSITNTIICCYDGDQAGRDAAWRLLNTALPYMHDNRQLKFIFLPKNEDPDTLIRNKGKIVFEQYINNAVSFTTFLFNKLSSNNNLTSCEDKAIFTNQLVPIINKIPNDTLKIYLYQQLGMKIGILDLQYLKKFILDQKKTISEEYHNINCITIAPVIKCRILRNLNALIVQNPKLAHLVKSDFMEIFKKSKMVGMSFFLKLINICKNHENLTTGQLIEFYRDTNFKKTLETLATWNHMIIDKEMESVLQDSLNKIYDLIRQQHLDTLIARDRIKKLNNNERREFWILNQGIKKKN